MKHRERRKLLKDEWVSEINNPVYRPALQVAWCRSCDRKISKGEPMVTWYSYRNRGQHIHICPECASKIGKLVEGKV
jgi:uncharacterized protein YlaI